MTPTSSSRTYVGITLSAALVAAGVRIRLDLPVLDDVSRFGQDVIARTIADPYRYRILGAYFTDVLARLTPNYTISYVIFVVALEMIALVIFVLALHRWLRLFAREGVATLATVFAALAIVNAMGANPAGYMWLEPAFVVAALLWLWNFAHRRRAPPLLYALLVVAACLNRETGLYLIVLFGACIVRSRSRRDWLWGLAYTTLGVATFGLVRLVLGPAERYWTFERIQAINMGDWLVSILDFVFLLCVYWWFAWRGWRTASPFLRALVCTMPIYLVPVLLFGIWSETRLFVPMFPLILALAVGAQERLLRSGATNVG
jgi:hypothetical protein